MTATGVLQAAGEAAQAIETVSWVLIAGAGAIFAGVMALLAASLLRTRPVLGRCLDGRSRGLVAG